MHPAGPAHRPVIVAHDVALAADHPTGGGHAEFDGVAFHIAARSAALRRWAGV